MNNKCLAHNQHHCVHAHDCKNPLHHQKLLQAQSKQLLNKKSLGNKKPQIPACKSGTLKPTFGSSLEKQKVVLNQQNSDRTLIKKVSPDCKNLEFQKMFLNINQKYNDLLQEFEQLKKDKNVLEMELKAQRNKNTQLQGELQKKTGLLANLNQLQSQAEKAKDLKQSLAASQNRGLNLEGEITKLKHTVETLMTQKDRIKQLSLKNAKRVEQVEDQYQKQNREKQNLKRKLQQRQTMIEQLQSQYKSLASKNKLNMNDIIDDYEKKLRALDQKFSFSCDQLNDLKKTQTKLKAKIKGLEEELHSERLKQSSKPKSQNSKVEKQLIFLQQKSTKDNQKLRETIIEYQHDKRKLEEELSRTNTRLTDQIRQLQKLLQIKQSQIQQLENIKLISEKEVDLLRENKQKRQKERQKRQEELRKIGREGNNTRSPNKGQSTNNNNDHHQHHQHEYHSISGIRGTYSEAITIRHLQNRNIQLQRQIQELMIRKTVPGETISINDYNQFEKVIKENNNHIKNLIQEKVKQIQSNSKLKVQVMELKNQLASRNSSTSTVSHEHHEEHKIREIAHYKNSLSEMEFQVKQLRNENFEINNRYSDYYILKDDNEELKLKLRELANVVETLNKAIIHNSYQKQALIVDNHHLADHLNIVTHLPRY